MVYAFAIHFVAKVVHDLLFQRSTIDWFQMARNGGLNYHHSGTRYRHREAGRTTDHRLAFSNLSVRRYPTRPSP